MDNLVIDIIDLAIREDIGDGDHTSLACILADAQGAAKLLVKDKGILAGVEVALMVFERIDPSLHTEVYIQDGEHIEPGQIAFLTRGPIRSLLQAERIVLNLMQRMSGIATKTKLFVDAIQGTSAKLLDTRKTTPGLRFFEKEAVRIGGGFNHRFGLYDMIMIKDNHHDFAGGITAAIQRTQQYLKATGRTLKIELEVRNEKELDEALRIGGIDRIMLDNFTPAQIAESLLLINRRYETEASGGITLENIRSYAQTGVDFISVGALTHSVMSLDMSFKAVKITGA